MPRMEGTTLHAILAPAKKSDGVPKKAASGTEGGMAPANKSAAPAAGTGTSPVQN